MPHLKFDQIAVYEVGKSWAGNTINTAIFRGAGITSSNCYQFCAYYDLDGRVVLSKRTLRSGKVEFASLNSCATLSDAHNGISFGIDAGGYLHISYGHHGSTLNYRRSIAPLDIGNWGPPSPMTGAWEDGITYPYFLTSCYTPGRMVFLYRRGTSSHGDLRLKFYDHVTRLWTDLDAPLLSGSGHKPWSAGPYMNHPAIGKDGRIHLFFTWRTLSIGPDERVNNHNLDYAVSDPSANVWESSDGFPFALPITPVNSESALGTRPGRNLINQSGAAVNSKGDPFAVSFMTAPDGVLRYFLLWRKGNEWHQRWLPLGDESFDLKGHGTLPCPLGRPDIIIDSSDTVWIIFRASFSGNRISALPLCGPEYIANSNMLQVLWHEDLLFYEPVIDRVRWARDNILSMYVQRADQGDEESLGREKVSSARIIEWKLRKV